MKICNFESTFEFILRNLTSTSPIGIFDSGYGGLTVFRNIADKLPQYDYLYLGDNARSPYGGRSFETVHAYTWQCVQWFFNQGSPLVILACNTASAKALRTIQQLNLPNSADPSRRVLGVIRPTTEVLGAISRTGKVGIMATKGTVTSRSYPIELEKFWPGVEVYQQACPQLVPLIENNEHHNRGGRYFIDKYTHALMEKNGDIDTVLLACTHYPIIADVIEEALPAGVKVLSQGALVADSLADYLQRHPELEERISKNGVKKFMTTDDPIDFDNHASLFYGENIQSEQVHFT